jgi:hypothetical protein
MEKMDMTDIYTPIFGESMGILPPYVGRGRHSGQLALLIYTEKVRGRENL